jgi:DNA (cytosine-5)-methyltransferase 1
VTATVTVLFCGAGGDSLGAEAAGMRVVMAANHWQTAIDVHQAHFPHAGHDCADISAADPRRYPVTDVLLASPECTNHSQARGVSRRRQDPTLWDAPDPAAERSRATMWDVVRFAEQMHYSAIVVENVVEATRWVGWRAWHVAMEDLGYDHRVLSHNSMHHNVAQSRDRIYVVFWRKGLPAPGLELELAAHCPRCDRVRTVRQAWKNGRTVGRYRQQWVWACTTCGATCEPATHPAAEIIDWTLPCPRIGDRDRPLAPATRARILAGLQRYGWAPIVTTGAGNGFERTPGNRARSVLAEPLPTQTATASQAMATAPGFLVQTARGDSHHHTHPLDRPHPTVCATDDRRSLVVHLRGTHPDQVRASAFATSEPLRTVSAGGGHHGLVVRSYGFAGSGPLARFVSTSDDPLPTLVTTQRPGLLMRNNQGGAEMVTPLSEPARTLTGRGHQSLLVPYNGRSPARPVIEPLGTQPTRDRWALVDGWPDYEGSEYDEGYSLGWDGATGQPYDDEPGHLWTPADEERVIDDCGFRMLEPHEITAAMAFPAGYIPAHLTKRDRVRLAGNAVTPPVMAWIAGRVLHALEAAA